MTTNDNRLRDTNAESALVMQSQIDLVKLDIALAAMDASDKTFEPRRRI
jgi:hypothetical protein